MMEVTNKMQPDSFVYREGLRYVPDTFSYNTLPSQVRTGIFTEIVLALRNETVAGIEEAGELLHIVSCRHLRFQYNTTVKRHYAIYVLEHVTFDLLRKANWDDLLQILEEWLASVLSVNQYTPTLKGLVNNQLVPNLNRLFLEEGIGWQVAEGKITRRQAPVLESRTREATLLLRGPKFQAAEQLWSKAVGALNRRPEPDIQNCIKDAVAAVEAMGNIVAATSGKPLDRLADELAAQSRIPKPLSNTLKPPFHYRGNEPGVAHGTGEISTARIEDAEYVLNWAAASIIYLSKV